MESGIRKRVEDAFAESSCAGGHVFGRANQDAVHGIDGDAILSVEGTRRKRSQRCREVLQNSIGINVGVEKDGKIDRIVALEAHLSGMKDRTGIQADIKFLQGNGWKRFSVRIEDERRDLDESGIDVQDIGRGVVRLSPGDGRMEDECSGKDQWNAQC